MSLTTNQEIFVQKLIEGCSQREAYRYAYSCEKWKDSSVDCEASKLFNTPKILQRYEELLEEHKNKALWNRSLAEEKLLWLLEKSQESIEYMGLKQANSSSMLNTIKELNTLTDLYPKKNKDNDIDLEDREAEKIANALLELRGKNGTR